MQKCDDKVFELFLNGTDTRIDIVHLKDLFYFLGHKISSEQLNFILEQYDIKGMSIPVEVVKLMIKSMRGIEPEDIFKAFAFYSKNEGCEVNVKDLKQVLRSGEDCFSEDELEEIVKHAECDYDGNFNYEMFVNKKLLEQ